jgi:hypothetical protein
VLACYPHQAYQEPYYVNATMYESLQSSKRVANKVLITQELYVTEKSWYVPVCGCKIWVSGHLGLMVGGVAQHGGSKLLN